MIKDIEKVSRRRAMIMMLVASTYLTWQVPSMDWVRSFEDGNRRLTDNVADFGQIAFTLALLLLVFSSRKIIPKLSKPAQDVLEDELVREHRFKAMRAGYLGMIFMAVFLFLSSRFQSIPGNDAARIMLAIGVALPLYWFAFLELRDG